MRSSRLRKTKPQDDEIKAHPPNPPQWGNEFNNSPPWRGAACGGEGAFFSFSKHNTSSKIRILFYGQNEKSQLENN